MADPRPSWTDSLPYCSDRCPNAPRPQEPGGKCARTRRCLPVVCPEVPIDTIATCSRFLDVVRRSWPGQICAFSVDCPDHAHAIADAFRSILVADPDPAVLILLDGDPVPPTGSTAILVTRRA